MSNDGPSSSPSPLPLQISCALEMLRDKVTMSQMSDELVEDIFQRLKKERFQRLLNLDRFELQRRHWEWGNQPPPVLCACHRPDPAPFRRKNIFPTGCLRRIIPGLVIPPKCEQCDGPMCVPCANRSRWDGRPICGPECRGLGDIRCLWPDEYP